MLMGSVSEEATRCAFHPTEAEWIASLTRLYGESKAAAAPPPEEAHPEKSMSRTLSFMCGGSMLNSIAIRNHVVSMAI